MSLMTRIRGHMPGSTSKVMPLSPFAPDAKEQGKWSKAQRAMDAEQQTQELQYMSKDDIVSDIAMLLTASALLIGIVATNVSGLQDRREVDTAFQEDAGEGRVYFGINYDSIVGLSGLLGIATAALVFIHALAMLLIMSMAKIGTRDVEAAKVFLSAVNWQIRMDYILCFLSIMFISIQFAWLLYVKVLLAWTNNAITVASYVYLACLGTFFLMFVYTYWNVRSNLVKLRQERAERIRQLAETAARTLASAASLTMMGGQTLTHDLDLKGLPAGNPHGSFTSPAQLSSDPRVLESMRVLASQVQRDLATSEPGRVVEQAHALLQEAAQHHKIVPIAAPATLMEVEEFSDDPRGAVSPSMASMLSPQGSKTERRKDLKKKRRSAVDTVPEE